MVSPTLMVSRVRPRLSRMEGKLVLAFQVSSTPFLAATSLMSPCGLRNWNSCTTPVTVTLAFSSQNTAKE
jgi:hypothetical protein